MKIYAFLLAFIAAVPVFAQTVEVKTENRALNIREIYHVLKSDSSIKEGEYTRYSLFTNKKYCSGSYKNNLKDGLWVDYSYTGSVADSGHYSGGIRAGIWTAYKRNEQMEVQYDFTNKQLLYYKPNPKDTAKKYTVIRGSDKTDVILDRPPIYIFGESGFSNVIVKNLHYPLKAREGQIQGKVVIRFIIDAQGRTSDFRVENGIGYGCDEESLSAVKLTSDDWLPGQLNGKPVAVYYEIPVSFTLSY